jgi:hypothetical protein
VTKFKIYFFLPFLAAAGVAVWGAFGIANPDTAMKTASQYLAGNVPDTHWELGKMMKVGEGLSKKWRLEFSGEKKDDRIIQANLWTGFPGDKAHA